MASLSTEVQNGKSIRRITYYDKHGKRKRIRLGEIGSKQAEAIRLKVEQLNDCDCAGIPLNGEIANWLAGRGDELYGKLAAAELVPPRQSSTIGRFVDDYIAERTDAKPNTIRNFKATRNKLVNYFGVDRDLRSITTGDGDQWRQSMLAAKCAEAVVSKAVKHARQFFKAALRRGLVASNPFTDVRGGSERNDSRLCFIDAATVDAIIEATTDVEWRLIIALARYGGLRTPSETLALKWSDVDWEKKRVTVPSPKTACHGKAYRVIPLFHELTKYLEAAFDAAPEGAKYVIQRYRGNEANLRTHFLRLIRKAGFQPWTRPFQNLRASRQTELADEFPAKVVSDWIGNSPAVAQQHYNQTTAEHFNRAVNPSHGAKGGANMGQKVGLHVNAPYTPGNAKTSDFSEVDEPDAELCEVGESGQYSLRESNPCCRTENPES